MPYGTVHSTTRELIESWARQSQIDIGKLHLEGGDDDREPGQSFNDGQEPVVISVIADGALDEEFTMGDLYAVNVADLIADQCESLMGKDLSIGYEIGVYEELYEDSGPLVYVRRSDPMVCKHCKEPLSKQGDEYKHVLGAAERACDPTDPNSKMAQPID